MKLYAIISTISWFVRNCYLPNPFETMGPLADLYNIGIEPLLYFVTFAIVGLFYRKGSFPAGGSALYLIFYILHVAILYIMSIMEFSIIWIILVLLVYIYLLSALNKLINY